MRYITFDSLSEAGALHAVFTRRGGVSPAPWDTLNMGSTVGDRLEHVHENRRRAFAAVGRAVESMADTWLVHGTQVHVALAPRPKESLPPKADVVLTNRPEVTLFMRYADCVPVALYDPQRKATALAHAGWQGTLKRTAAAAVEAMQTHFGSRPADILAVIGPSICSRHYRIGVDVQTQVAAAFGRQAAAFLPRYNGATHFDLWQANHWVLESAGVHQIEMSNLCTACQVGDWYSHRAEAGATGRFGFLLAIGS
jgi:YfiH family protein